MIFLFWKRVLGREGRSYGEREREGESVVWEPGEDEWACSENGTVFFCCFVYWDNAICFWVFCFHCLLVNFTLVCYRIRFLFVLLCYFFFVVVCMDSVYCLFACINLTVVMVLLDPFLMFSLMLRLIFTLIDDNNCVQAAE